MTLLLQLNGAVKESPHPRMFYVWVCRNKTCARKPGSVKVIRGVKVSPKEAAKMAEEEARRNAPKPAVKKPMPQEGAGAMLFSGGAGANPFGAPKANPFSSGPAPAMGANPFAATPKPAAEKTEPALETTFAAALTLNLPPAPKEEPEPLLYGPSEPWPSPAPNAFPHFYLDADMETLEIDAPAPTQKIEFLADDDTSMADMPVSNSTADDGMLDTTFQKFADRCAQNPDQVLRYERGGVPLLYSDSDEVGKIWKEGGKGKVPACKSCGKRDRVFEFQIMPHAISVLEAEEGGLEGMEWGTIVAATCLCVPKVRDGEGVGWVEEWCGVQWEGQA